MSKKSKNIQSKGPDRYTTARPSYAPSPEKGKSFAYYDKEPRTDHPWGEPAQRPIIMEDEGRYKRVYADGSLAQGVLSPIAIEKSVEIGGIAAKAFKIPTDEEGRIQAAEELGLYGQDLDDYLGQSSASASAAEAA